MESYIIYAYRYYIILLSCLKHHARRKKKQIQKCAMYSNQKQGLFLVTIKIRRKRFLYMDFIAKTIILI